MPLLANVSILDIRSMSAFGTTRTFRNVRNSVAVGCKADIEQAASEMSIYEYTP
jgi:hypothetical protein